MALSEAFTSVLEGKQALTGEDLVPYCPSAGEKPG